MASQRRAAAEQDQLLDSATKSPTLPTPTLDSMHWHQTASTLLSENLSLREALKQKETECSNLQAKLFQAGQALSEREKQLAAATREVLILEADRLTPPLVFKKSIQHIPVNTQGKDAMYWHQACRTLQMQYMELKAELDTKTDQFIRLTHASNGALLLKQGAESPPCKETPPPAGKTQCPTGCETEAP